MIQDKRCEITAIPAASVVSFPSPLGITIVFKPSGMESEQTAQMYTVWSNFTSIATPMKMSGSTISLKNEIM